MELFVNDEPRTVPAGITVAELLAELGLSTPHVAVELNLEVVPRGRHAAQVLSAGDRLEIVSLVGGG